jgi:predicted sulfurtransferase
MKSVLQYKIAAFYKFVDLRGKDLPVLRSDIGQSMKDRGIVGTVILAAEGVNSTIC